MATSKFKKLKKKSQRVRVRNPELVAAFCGRFAAMLRDLPVTQLSLARKLGGVSNQLLSRVAAGKATTLSIDFLVHLGDWAARNGVSLPWLFAGHGTMFQGGKGGLGLEWLAGASRDELIGELSRLIVDAEHVRQFLRANGDPKACAALVELLGLGPLRADTAPARPRIPGYRTVEPEAVPTSHDWHKHYVPVIGRIAAGSGIDTVEAAEYPPGWAAEFLVYDGAPPTSVAVRVTGGSMEPDYAEGDMVVVDPAAEADWGEVCCVLVRSGEIVEARLKRPRLAGGGRAVLESLSADPQYAPQPVALSSVIRRYPILDHLPLVRRRPEGRR